LIRGLLYLSALLAVFAYVEFSNEREPRIAMWTLVTASFLTLGALLSGATFYVASGLLTALDFLVLAVFLAHALPILLDAMPSGLPTAHLPHPCRQTRGARHYVAGLFGRPGFLGLSTDARHSARGDLGPVSAARRGDATRRRS
jgi:hypothetical protein